MSNTPVDPFDKYKAELASVGLISINGSIKINIGEFSWLHGPDWVGPIHKFKDFRKHTKTVERLVRCHERNGAKPLLVTNTYHFHRKRVEDPKTRRWKYEIDYSIPIEYHARVLFASRGKIVSMFDIDTSKLILVDGKFDVDEFFSMTPERQNELIEPDEFVRLVAQTARHMN